MVRQIGLPQLIRTFAPAEWLFPLHAAVTDAMHHSGLSDIFSSGEMVATNVSHAPRQICRIEWFQALCMETTCVGECI